MRLFLCIVALLILAEIEAFAIQQKMAANIAGAKAGKEIAEMIRNSH